MYHSYEVREPSFLTHLEYSRSNERTNRDMQTLSELATAEGIALGTIIHTEGDTKRTFCVSLLIGNRRLPPSLQA